MNPASPKHELAEHDGDLRALLLGYLILGMQPVPVRMLSSLGLGSAESVVARFVFSALSIVGICLWRRRGLSTQQPMMLLLRGILGAVAVQLYFYSVQEAGAGRATLLNYTYPLWANVLSLFQGARPRPRFWALLGIALVGVSMIVLPEHGGFSQLGRGELDGLLSGMTAGASVLTLQRLRSTDESLTILASFTLCGLVFSLPFLSYGRELPPINATFVFLLVMVGATSFFGHIFFTRGYRSVRLTLASALSLLVPFLATLLGHIFLNEPLSVRFAWGAVLLLLALGAIPFVDRVRPKLDPPTK